MVFVFPGQGAQWVGMAVQLMAECPVFAESMAACEVALAPYVDWSLREVLGDEVALVRVDVVQPVLWAVMVSLAGGGGMVSLEASVAEVEGLLSGLGVSGVGVVAVNGSDSVVVSGGAVALDELQAVCEGRGVRARRIAVDYASHSAEVKAVEAELLGVLGEVEARRGEMPLYSTVTGGLLDTSGMDAAYWYRNLRETVRFAPAVEELAGQGYGVPVCVCRRVPGGSSRHTGRLP
ncbi:acyltransferase domain-containing protein [Streptomyces sp. NPDC056323]|uniref:acyltransferase domain-containing protein n=1 Tax=Streptomyces sp. NPDC056323 TaxID=3345784 RepID=UPI0035E13A5A